MYGKRFQTLKKNNGQKNIKKNSYFSYLWTVSIIIDVTLG